MTEISVVGCGYISDSYMSTLADYPGLKIRGIYDRVPERMNMLASRYGHPTYASFDELLGDDKVKIVLDLTNPHSHYDVNRAILESGKHVYSEKPFAMEFEQALALYDLARSKDLRIVSAPCSLLGEQAQTIWKALRDKIIGDVWVVYAELNEGPIHLMGAGSWKNASGVPWPLTDEFEVGCTLEHAGYYLTWMVAWFGPAKEVTAFSSRRIRDKRTSLPLDPADTPDFSVATIKFESGVVARLTNSIMAEHDHELKIYGEKGILAIDECWNYGNPVRLRYYDKRSMRGEKYPLVRKSALLRRLYGLRWKDLPFVKTPDRRTGWNGRRPPLFFMDFARGVNELAQSIEEGRSCRLSPELSLHVNELSLAIQNAGESGSSYRLKTTCGPVDPMDWAR